MKIDYRSLQLDKFTCSRKTKESSFRKHFGNGEEGFASKEGSCRFRVTEQEQGLSFSGTAVFTEQKLSHITLYLLSSRKGQDLKEIAASMLGKPNVSGKGAVSYTFSTMEIMILHDNFSDSPYLSVSFYKALRRPFLRFDPPAKFRHLYHYCGIRRYLKLLFLTVWTVFFFILSASKISQAQKVETEGYHVYEDGYRFAFTKEKDGYEEGLERAIEMDRVAEPSAIKSYYSESKGYFCTGSVFLIFLLYYASGFYNLERFWVGRSMRKFTDGRKRGVYYDTLMKINEELEFSEYKDYYITVTKNWVVFRDYPFYHAMFVPRNYVTSVSDGIIKYHNRHHIIRRPCLNIHTPDGLLHQYAQSAERMKQVKEILMKNEER